MAGEVDMDTDEIHHCQVKKQTTLDLMTSISRGLLLRKRGGEGPGQSHASPKSLGLEGRGELKTTSQNRSLSWGPSWGRRPQSIVP